MKICTMFVSGDPLQPPERRKSELEALSPLPQVNITDKITNIYLDLIRRRLGSV